MNQKAVKPSDGFKIDVGLVLVRNRDRKLFLVAAYNLHTRDWRCTSGEVGDPTSWNSETLQQFFRPYWLQPGTILHWRRSANGYTEELRVSRISLANDTAVAWIGSDTDGRWVSASQLIESWQMGTSKNTGLLWRHVTV